MKITLIVLLILSIAGNIVLGYYYQEEKSKALYHEIKAQEAQLEKMSQLEPAALDTLRHALDIIKVKP